MNPKIQAAIARTDAHRALRELRALSVLTNQLSPEVQAILANRETQLAVGSDEAILEMCDELQEKVSELRQHYGVKIPGDKLVEEVEAMKSRQSTSTWVLVPKYNLEEIFDRYDRVMPNFPTLPKHANIAIFQDKHPRGSKVEVFLLEAVLFEDMAALFNLAKAQEGLDRSIRPKRMLKTADALERATVTAAFDFVEAYLNGIATDHFISHKSSLTEDTKDLLQEWDSKKKRKRYLTLRDKALQYPRIILGLPYPPLTENNTPELGFICGRAKEIRDAIVHPAVGEGAAGVKQEKVFTLNLADVEATVDNAIQLVRKIEATIQGNDRRLLWMRDRDANGFFSDETFN